MDEGRYRVFKLILKIFLGVLGLGVGGYGLYVINQVSNNVEATNIALSRAHAVANANTSIFLGPGNARISEEFASEIQACWYYQATYENLHPYTVLWEQSEKGKYYPKIRVIADGATWEAHRCIKEKDSNGKEIVKLVGKEKLTHQIEVQFDEDTEYEHVATSNAEYFSALFFGEKGRILERKIIKADQKCIPPENFSVKINGCISRDFEDDESPSKNIVRITKLIKNEDKYIKALELYLDKRKGLYNNLTEQGCGAVPIEPEFASTKEGDIEKPSIIFLCHRNGKKSHVRVMIRKDSKSDQKKSAF